MCVAMKSLLEQLFLWKPNLDYISSFVRCLGNTFDNKIDIKTNAAYVIHVKLNRIPQDWQLLFEGDCMSFESSQENALFLIVYP